MLLNDSTCERLETASNLEPLPLSIPGEKYRHKNFTRHVRTSVH